MKSTKLFRSFIISRRTRILLGVALVFVLAVALFDWNWFRGPLVNHLAERSGRDVRIEDLDVSFSWRLEPTVRLRGLYVPNAPWGSKQPMAVAREVAFTFAIESLWEQRPIITQLVLVDADISMEREANGARNWRLLNPDYRGPGKVRVQTLKARNTKIRFINREIDLDLTAQATPADAAVTVYPAESLSNNLTVRGKYQGAEFEGAGLVSDVLSCRDSGVWFGWRGYLASGKTRVKVDGRFADLFDSGPLDAQMHLAGPTLSRLHPFVKFRPPVTRPFEFNGHLVQADKKYSFSQLKGKIGTTDIAGEATYDRKPERPVATASLHSASADLQDLVFLAGMDYRRVAAADAARRTTNAATEDTEPPGTNAPAEAPANASKQAGSARAFHAEKMRKVDAHVELDVKKLRAPAMPLIESLRFAADLTDGALDVPKMELGVAGGHVAGSLGFDARVSPPAARVRLDASNIRLERILPGQFSTKIAAGDFRSHLKMTAHGNSVAALLASADGTFVALMDGGRISNLLDAKLGLNAGKVVKLKIRGDDDIALHCGAAAFAFHKGLGKSQLVLLETEQTHTDGAGTINLRDQTLDLLLTPHPKSPGWFTLNSSIRVQGPISKAHYKLDTRVPLRPGGSAVPPAAATALFRPLLIGHKPNGQCATMLGARAGAAETLAVKE